MRHAPWLALALALGCSDGGPRSLDDTDVGVDSDPGPGLDTGDTAAPGDGRGWPDDPSSYPFTDITYLSAFTLPEGQGGVVPCCRDWGAMSKDAIREGTDRLDNALALLAGLVGEAGGVQDQLDASIRSGAFVGLLDHHQLPEEGGRFPLAFLRGAFAEGSSWYDAVAGDAEILVDPASFVPGTGRPRVIFEDAQLEGDRLTAEGAGFDLPVPLIGADLILPVEDVRLDARVTRSAGGVGFTDGALSGYVRVDAFFSAYNDVVRRNCGCAGVSGDLFRKTGDVWQASCGVAADVAERCPGDHQPLCVQLVSGGTDGMCALLSTFGPVAADLDLDGDTRTFEALSLGLWVDGVPAKVTGVVGR